MEQQRKEIHGVEMLHQGGEWTVSLRCTNRVESELQEVTVKTINQLLSCSDSMMQILRNNIQTALADDNSREIDRLNIVLKEKQKELVKLAHAKKDYTALADEIDILRDKKQELLVKRAETEGVKK